MIDPDNIIIQKTNLSNQINIKEIPVFDFEVYNLDDDKDYEKYVKDIEKEVRRSYEYRGFVRYLHDNMDMNKCSFIKGVSNSESYDIKIELHHYPFTLRDIVEIVIRKRTYYRDSLQLQMVSKEVMELHYKLLIGIIPLSETVHKLVHKGRLFIPVDRVLGRYNVFIDYYKPFCTPEQLECIERIEKYTYENNSELLDTTIIDQNYVSYNITPPQYQLPEFNNISNNMIKQIESIKNNNYLLPDIHTKEKPICPITFLD